MNFFIFIFLSKESIKNFNNPELINNSRETTPAHRLEKFFTLPKYKKVLHGNIIANNIGIPKMREQCPHFDKWCTKIEILK